jgi:hypothetical protein
VLERDGVRETSNPETNDPNRHLDRWFRYVIALHMYHALVYVSSVVEVEVGKTYRWNRRQ